MISKQFKLYDLLILCCKQVKAETSIAQLKHDSKILQVLFCYIYMLASSHIFVMFNINLMEDSHMNEHPGIYCWKD